MCMCEGTCATVCMPVKVRGQLGGFGFLLSLVGARD